MGTRTARILARCWALSCLAAATLRAEDAAVRVTFTDMGGAAQTLDARLLVEAADGGLLLEDRAGALWNVTPDRLQAREALPDPVSSFDHDELGRHLKTQLGGDFAIVKTKHYVICTSAPRHYAEWCGTLFERLLRAFLLQWERAGLELHEPAAPLPAIVFATQQQYAAFATRDAGPQLADKAGYYSVRSNCIVLFDLTTAIGGDAPRSADDVSRRVAAAPGNVATIVHEATHQIAFNSGLHTRYADNPMWVTEGMAMYFETPDLRSGSGWTTIGKLNLARLRQFKDYAESRRPADSLVALISGEDRFRDPEAAADAYAEAWALTYFLIRTRRDDYVQYLRMLADKPRLRWDTPDRRHADFAATFGDLDENNAHFTRYSLRLGQP